MHTTRLRIPLPPFGLGRSLQRAEEMSWERRKKRKVQKPLLWMGRSSGEGKGWIPTVPIFHALSYFFFFFVSAKGFSAILRLLLASHW